MDEHSREAAQNDHTLHARMFKRAHPCYYDKTGTWWLWDGEKKRYARGANDADIINRAKQLGVFYTTNRYVTQRSRILDSIKDHSQEDPPQPLPAHYIQVGTRIYDITTGQSREATPRDLVPNILPFEPGKSTQTPIIDRLFEEWVGPRDAITLKEIAAYCFYRDYPFHNAFVFIGIGSNGKSCYLQLLKNLIGVENSTTSDLSLLEENAFESYNLYKQLACFINETTYEEMKSLKHLKLLTGQDLIGFQAKHKNTVHEMNYAKLLIATNSLPSIQDESDGMMRRWFIIDFPNQFNTGEDVLARIPQEEYENFTRYCIEALPALLARKHFTYDMSIDERRERFYLASNPLPSFIKEHCEPTDKTDEYCHYNEFMVRYRGWLREKKRRQVGYRELRDALMNSGYVVERIHYFSNERPNVIMGLGWEKPFAVEKQEDGTLIVHESIIDAPTKQEVLRYVQDQHAKTRQPVVIDSVARYFHNDPSIDKHIQTLLSEGELTRPTPNTLLPLV